MKLPPASPCTKGASGSSTAWWQKVVQFDRISNAVECALSSVVEHLLDVKRVGGSNPSARTKKKVANKQLWFVAGKFDYV